MMEQDWIDCKQHWNESLRDMYHENKRLKVKAKSGDKLAKEMAEEYMNTEQHAIKLSNMKDRGKKRELEGMVDDIWKLKFCRKKGAECYFRELDAIWEATLTMCDYEVPIEICMQKATCAILIAELPWNMTNKANLEWWNGMGFIEREDVWDAFKCHWTCRLQKIKNEDDTDPLFPDNDDDSDIDKDEKVNDGRDEIKALHGWNKACKRCADKKAKQKCRYYEICVRVPAKKRGRPSGSKNRNQRISPNKKKLKKAEEASKEEKKSGNRQKGDRMSERLYSTSKEALEILLEKMRGKENSIEINLEDETPEQSLERIAIERIRRNAGNYKEVSSDENSNENGKAEEDTVNGEDREELQEERNEHAEEEDRENKEGADPLAVGTNQELQKGDTENSEEKAANGTDASEKNEREEKQITWKDYLQMLPSWW
eukprot:jgi/Psemu1/36924/gm1.36924_g